MTFEEFKKLRREVFLRGVYGLVLLVIMTILVGIMMAGDASDANAYKFRTISFIIGIVYLSDVMNLAKRVAPVQKAHPDWVEKTGIKNGPVELPAQWNRKRLAVTAMAIAVDVIAFFTLY